MQRHTFFSANLLAGLITVGTIIPVHAQLPRRPASPPAYISKGGVAKTGSAEAPLTTQYLHGDPTAEEQWILERINWARAHPDSEGIRLANINDQYVNNDYTQWGTPTRAEVRDSFATYPVMPPLAFSASLITSATNHSKEMLAVDSMYHVGPDGSPLSRMNGAGYFPTGYSGENCGAYDRDLEEDHDGFQVDWGNPGLGHRMNDMNFDPTGPFYSEIGIGIVHTTSGWPDVGPIITTEDFGDRGKTFILGVAYTDKNHNNFYDIGEGDSGVTITVSGGSYYAVTSGSGGYAIPYTGTGTVTVTASGGGFPTPVTKTIDFEEQNVKVDFNPDLTGYPSQAILIAPEAAGMINFDSATFVWNSVPLAASYHLKIGTDSLLKQKLLANDSGLKDTTFKFGLLKDSTTYYWSVQAKNSKGLGPWAAIEPFSTSFVPSVVMLVAPANTTTLADSAVPFVWRMADKGATNYALQIASSKAMTNVIWSDTLYFDATDTSAIAPATLFTPGSTYYWTVLAQNDNGWSKSGTPRSFSISSAGVNPLPGLGTISMTLSPNPTTGIVHLRYTLGSSAEVSFRVFNSLGQSVKAMGLGTRPAGTNEYDFDGSSLPPGTYSMELWVGGRLELGRIVIER